MTNAHLTSDFAPEMDLLVQCMRSACDEGDRRRVQDLVRQRLDWNLLLWEARRHRLTSLLYYRIKRACPRLVPGDRMQQLKVYDHINAKRGLLLSAHVLKILRRLGQHNILAVPLNGPVLASLLFQNPTLCHMDNLQFLVRPEDAAAVCNILNAEAYEPLNMPNTFHYRDGLFQIRLHTAIAMDPISTRSLAKHVWRRLDHTTFQNRDCPILSPGDQLLFLCASGAGYMWRCLHMVQDVARLIKHCEILDWASVFEQARILRWHHALSFVLSLTRTITQIELPGEVQERLAISPDIDKLVAQTTCWIGHPSRRQSRPLEHVRMVHKLHPDSWRKWGNMLPRAGRWACRIPQKMRSFLNHRRDFGEYKPTPYCVVQEMLNLASIQPDDKLYDLGCGDGRIVITAAKRYGICAVGIDHHPERIAEARQNACIGGVENQVEFIQCNVMDIDLSEATIVTLYLYNYGNLKLLSKLRKQLKNGARVISRDFTFGEWVPHKTVLVPLEMQPTYLYLWRM